MNKLAKYQEMLLDPEFQFQDGYGIIEDVKRAIGELSDHFAGTKEEFVMMCELSYTVVDNLLVRLRNYSPHVYAITVGQFSGYDGIEDFWVKEGFHDTEGYQWLMPKTFGPFISQRFQG